MIAMEMMLKVAGISLSVLLLATVLKKTSQEQALVLVLLSVVIVFQFVLGALGEILNYIKKLAEIADIQEELWSPVVKTVAISVISHISAELCRGGGENGLASMVEFTATILCLLLALPLMEGVMTMMVAML